MIARAKGIVLRYWPQMLPYNQDRTEVRLLSAILALLFFCHLMEPALYAASVDESILARVTNLSTFPEFTLMVFFGCALMIVPHFVSLVFMPTFLHCRTPRRLACFGAFGAALLWFYLANLARPLDAGPLEYIYCARAIVNMFISGVFAFSLNSQQIRELRNAPAQS